MKAYFEDSYGTGSFIFENGEKEKVNGQFIKYEEILGKAHCVRDKANACGGHGCGDVYCCQLLIVDHEMNIHIIPDEWKKYNITILNKEKQ